MGLYDIAPECSSTRGYFSSETATRFLLPTFDPYISLPGKIVMKRQCPVLSSCGILTVNNEHFRYISHTQKKKIDSQDCPRQCNLYKSVPDTLLCFTVCITLCCILRHPGPDFKKINPNSRSSVTYMPHHLAKGLLYHLPTIYNSSSLTLSR